jgi:hypothetical protein
MNKPWIGYVASGLILVAGVLELLAGKITLGVFLMVMAVISLLLRIYFLKKLKGGEKKD